ncbi:MAG: arginine--tRNA ligase [Flavobacteriaceae bacterium]
MKSLDAQLSATINAYLSASYALPDQILEFQSTRSDFEGDRTVVLFPLLKSTRANPQQLGEAMGAYLVQNSPWVEKFNVVKGFLNLCISDRYYLSFLISIAIDSSYGHTKATDSSDTIMVEYSSPNTNKPLHLGHIRNNLLGYSVAKILEASGKKVIKTQIINDRGIHICKSMVAWQQFGKGETPADVQIKGDQLVGKYYVLFDQHYKQQVKALQAAGKSEEEASKEAPLLLEAQNVLRRWEANDPEVRKLWERMNNWVYQGFEETYQNLGVSFDTYYYESDTYLLGKNLIAEGLNKELFYQKPDGSVWVDLTDDGLDEKLLLRSDGTAVYMTQDLGTATQRVKDHPEINGMVYTVGNEQDYHFKVLFLILKKLGYEWAADLCHLSYGMVDLPSGKMKSREGTVVDADDLIVEMESTAQKISETHGKLDVLKEEDKKIRYRQIGLGALKYYILKVDPKKRILFDPEASVDFNGNTGPFIQYTHARIQSILRKAPKLEERDLLDCRLEDKERAIIKHLAIYPAILQQAAEQHNPALVANYVYELVKKFNSFYQNISILGEVDETLKSLRILLSKKVGEGIASACDLLGIHAPDRM